MSNREDRMEAEDGRLDAVLGAIGSAEPERGFEARVLRRLEMESAVVAARPTLAWRMLRPRFLLTTAVAACTVCSAALLLRYGGVSHHWGAARPPASMVAASVPDHAVSAPTPNVQPRNRELLLSSPVSERTRVVTIRSEGRAVMQVRMASTGRAHELSAAAPGLAESARIANVPAPEMPLTEQERLLLRIAHRDDPLQVAMLDPVARNLRQAREQAEARRFFTPEPLPAELQQQIYAALRSQYVNTPPPPELLPTDRSQP